MEVTGGNGSGEAGLEVGPGWRGHKQEMLGGGAPGRRCGRLAPDRAQRGGSGTAGQVLVRSRVASWNGGAHAWEGRCDGGKGRG